ncbi:MAG TPA: WD40 repeat domain-containing protein, partial [Pseudomonadota bacterium]|nr:WD40 repeat domain-containing protein [Pseudomonadota bacterium]
LLSTDGKSFKPGPLPVSDVILRGVWGGAPGDVWAVGDSGTALHWNGAAWQETSPATLATLRAVWGRDAATVYAVGSSGTIQRWNGAAWKSEDSGTGNTLVSIWGTGQDVYALGTGGAILHKSLR